MSPRKERYAVPRNAVRTFKRETKKMVNGPYYCPNCGKTKIEVAVDAKEKAVEVICRGCGVKNSLSYAPVFQPVDYYNKFVDQLKKQP